MKGKEICKTLKSIRSEIAKKNEIPYKPHECTHTGDCAGTCPACEAEVKKLEAALEKRRKNGFKIVLAGVSAGLVAMNAASCDIVSTQGDMLPGPDVTEERAEVGEIVLDGDMVMEDTLMGDIPPETAELTIGGVLPLPEDMDAGDEPADFDGDAAIPDDDEILVDGK